MNHAARRVSEFLIGGLFGWGLLLSGMTDPGKVLGFLDLAGAWDPSLALVMAGALGVTGAAFAWARRRPGPMMGGVMQWPTARQIDPRLLWGSVLFGAGWGLAGFCPGPAVVSFAAGHWQAAVFVAAMLVGMAGWAGWSQRTARTLAGAARQEHKETE